MSDEDPFNHDGAYMDRGNGTPVLRADATDDEPEEYGTGNPEDMQTFEADPDPAEPATVEPELRVKARTVPVVVQGVLHGYREADEED